MLTPEPSRGAITRYDIPSHLSPPHSLLVCKKHARNAFVSRSEFVMNVASSFHIMKGTASSIHLLNPSLLEVITYGMLELKSILEGNGIWDESCDLCNIVDFLLGKGGVVLLLGLIVLEKNAIFKYCLSLLTGYMPREDINDFGEKLQFYSKHHREYRLKQIIS